MQCVDAGARVRPVLVNHDGRDGLEIFVKEHEQELRVCARRLALGHGVDADELYSAACLALVRHWPLGVDEDVRLSQAIGFVFNTMRDLRKTQYRRARRVHGPGGGDGSGAGGAGGPGDEPAAPTRDETENRAMSSIEEQEIARLIAGLAHAFDREVISLKWAGCSLREIQRITGEEYRDVRTAFERARKALRGRYADGEGRR